MNYHGLRDWLVKIDERGELRALEDVDWNLEMGAIVDVLYREHPPYPPALIFDKSKVIKLGTARCSATSLHRNASRSPWAPVKTSTTCWNSPAPTTRK